MKTQEMEALNNELRGLRDEEDALAVEKDFIQKDLKVKRHEQSEAILRKNNDKADMLADEIVSLQSRLTGVNNAKKKLSSRIAVLDVKRSNLAEVEAGSLASQLEKNCIEVETRIYEQLVGAIQLLPELNTLRKEYVSALRSAGARGKSDTANHMVSSLIDRVRNQVIELIVNFPKSVKESGKVKSVEEIKRIVRTLAR